MSVMAVDVPALIKVGHEAQAFSTRAKDADHKVDGTRGCLPQALASAGKLDALESVWTEHLDDLKDDLRAVGENLVTTAQTCRGHDAAGADLFAPISWADQHHYGVRP